MDNTNNVAQQCAKRIKLDLTQCESINCDSLDNNKSCDKANQMNKRPRLQDLSVAELPERNEIRAILNDKYYKSLETVQVFTCEINNRKETSRLLREINEIYNLKELKHLKRVRNEDGQLKIIITTVREDVSNSLREDVSSTLKELFYGTSVDTKGLSEPSVTLVPKNSPLTRQQYEAWSKLWPTGFHEDKHITRLLNGEIFDKVELQEMRGYMREAIDAALVGKQKGMSPVGAVIVNPKTRNILCKAHDLSCDHPLQHATMVCIDLVGKLQDGGAWDIKLDFTEEGHVGTNEDKKGHCGILKDKQGYVGHSEDKEEHCGMLKDKQGQVGYSEDKKEPCGMLKDKQGHVGHREDKEEHCGMLKDKQGQVGTNEDKGEHCRIMKDKQGHLNKVDGNDLTTEQDICCVNNLNSVPKKGTSICLHQDGSASKVGSRSLLTTVDNSSDNNGPYLCTGYDLYITREPCVMCSMALLHSRIHRVFYAHAFPSFGGLGSKFKIHCLEGTNHHFEVFSGLLETECRQLLS